MSPEYKKARTIMWLGIISIIVMIASFGLLAGYVVALVSVVDKTAASANDLTKTLPLLIGFILLIIASAVLALIPAVMILTTNFKNAEVNESKLLWGLLSLLMIGSLGAIIFGVSTMKKLGNANTSNQADKSIDKSSDLQPTI